MKQNRIYIILGVVLVIVVAVVVYFKSQSSSAGKFVTFKDAAVVEMGSDTYTPANFKIKKGTVVTFKNVSDGLRWPASDFHPSHLLYPEFDPKQPIGKGETWKFQFDKVGEWGYHDHLAPYITGRIQVVE